MIVRHRGHRWKDLHREKHRGVTDGEIFMARTREESQMERSSWQDQRGVTDGEIFIVRSTEESQMERSSS
jgi:hypothetical protein